MKTERFAFSDETLRFLGVYDGYTFREAVL